MKKYFIEGVIVLLVAFIAYRYLSNISTQYKIRVGQLEWRYDMLQKTVPAYYERSTAAITFDSVNSIADEHFPKIIFRFKNSYCDPCVKKQIQLLKERYLDNPVDLLFVGSFLTNEDEQDFIEEIGYNVDLVSISDLTLPAENYELPYYFLLDYDNGRYSASNFFFPVSEDEILSKNYLDFIENEFLIK